MATVKYSRQREAIKDYLMHTTSHPTAETIYDDLKRDDPKLSLGTVYRNLALMYSQGDVLKLSCGNDCIHYDGNTSPHYHLVCTECGNVFDIPIESMDHIDTLAQAGFDGKVTGHQVYFLGKCKKCIDKES